MTAESIRTVDETGSTNDDLAALARDGAREGSWLRARVQTGGRGRQGRTWASAPGNLHASTLVRLRSADPAAASLALVAAIALHEVAKRHAPDAAILIKWPNDLVSGGAKLAGILLERSEDAVVVGFGVNLASRPEGLGRAATCLEALAGRAPEPDAFLGELAAAFAAWLSRWRGEGLGPVRTRWLECAHPPGTALAATSAGGGTVEGLFDGLEPDGALRLRLADGALRIVRAGDVFLV